MSNITASSAIYENLCAALDIKPVSFSLKISEFSDINYLSNTNLNERLTAAIQVLIECFSDADSFSNNHVPRVDKHLIDEFIANIDDILSLQLDEILHHPDFKSLESLWRNLAYLVDKIDFRSNIKLDLLNISKEALTTDFENAPELIQSGLYKHIYEKEYDTPGGQPITTIISDYSFNAGVQDIALLRNIASISAATHCPFIANVNPQFFGKANFEEVSQINDLANYMDRSEYIRWNSFREIEDARYIGLVMPRFLLRLPYGKDNCTRTFQYNECVFDHLEKYLWGMASFPFAANMARSFREYGWTVNIRGPESGGKVQNLLLHQYDFGRGLCTKIPTEILIPETRELELATLGFIPMSYYKNSDFACYFSANSAQKPTLYQNADATANSRINSRLPYIFLSSRIAHYLKVLQRETIGSNVSRIELENRLNEWLQTLITKMNNPDPEQMSKHPLRDGKVEVTDIEDNPGFYRVTLYAMPHFQIEGVDVSLSVVAKMPTKKN
jgi:type VI secretion system protein ImpC